MNKREFGRRFQSRREACNLSQADLASLAGVKQQQVSKWENGVVLPSARLLPVLNHALQFTNGELYVWMAEVAEESQDEISEVRRERDRAFDEMKRFSDTYKQFHAAYEKMGNDLEALSNEVAEIKRLIVERFDRPESP